MSNNFFQFGLETNIAMRGIATQSDISGDARPEKAIDGNSDSDMNHKSCSSTMGYLPTWWRLDLLKPYKINNVTVVLRNKYHDRIRGAEIRIGNSLAHYGNVNPRYHHFLHDHPENNS